MPRFNDYVGAEGEREADKRKESIRISPHVATVLSKSL